jgi:hypothetical protein
VTQARAAWGPAGRQSTKGETNFRSKLLRTRARRPRASSAPPPYVGGSARPPRACALQYPEANLGVALLERASELGGCGLGRWPGPILLTGAWCSRRTSAAHQAAAVRKASLARSSGMYGSYYWTHPRFSDQRLTAKPLTLQDGSRDVTGPAKQGSRDVRPQPGPPWTSRGRNS